MIIVDNIKFYPTKQGYYLGSLNNKPKRLHVYIWEKHNGPVPKGYHIHHIDGDKLNNDIDNLEIVLGSKHLSQHNRDNAELYRKVFIEKVLPKAVEWHKSEKATQFHKDHYEKYMREKWNKPVTKTCQFCGKEYTTVHAKLKTSKFCSNTCKTKNRKASKIDDVPISCLACGKEFMSNKYSPHTYCSNECRTIYRRQK